MRGENDSKQSDGFQAKKKLEEARKFLAETHTLEDLQNERLQVCTPPQPKDRKNAIEIEEGHYLVSRCAMEKSTSDGLKNGSLPPAAWRRQQLKKKEQASRFGDIFFNKRQTKKI